MVRITAFDDNGVYKIDFEIPELDECPITNYSEFKICDGQHGQGNNALQFIRYVSVSKVPQGFPRKISPSHRAGVSPYSRLYA